MKHLYDNACPMINRITFTTDIVVHTQGTRKKNWKETCKVNGYLSNIYI